MTEAEWLTGADPTPMLEFLRGRASERKWRRGRIMKLAQRIYEERRFEDASPRFRLDAAVAEYAELLRRSYWAREGKWSDVLDVARRAARDSREPAADEFVRLVEKAADLSKQAKPGQR